MTEKPRKYGPSGVMQGSDKRQSQMFVGKRVTESQKVLLARLAAHRGVRLADLLAPHIDQLLAEAAHELKVAG